jgi:hypothetical protein
MKISQDIRNREDNIASVEIGMQEKSQEFKEQGFKIYK